MALNKRMKNQNIVLFTILFTLINLVAKIWNIHEHSLYGDEPFSLFFSQQSLPELFDRIINDKNPFLYFMILHGWIKFYGVTVVNAKLLSAIFSSLAGGLIFALGTKRFNSNFGLVAAGLFLVSFSQYFYAHEIRAFALVSLLAVLSIFIFLELIRNPKKWHIPALAFVNLVMILSHYASFLLPIIEFIGTLLFIKQNKKTFFYFIYSQIIAFVFFLPWFLYSTINHVPTAGEFWLAVPTPYRILKVGMNVVNPVLMAVNLLSFIIIYNPGLRKKTIKKEFDKKIYFFLSLVFWGTLILNFLVSQKFPILLDRYVLFASIGIFLAISYLFTHLNLSKVTFATSFIILLGFLLSVNSYDNQQENWPELVNKVKKNKNNNTLVIIHQWWEFRAFSYYYNPDYFRDYKNTVPKLRNDNIYPIGNANSIKELIQNNNPEKIIIVMCQSGKKELFFNLMKKSGYKNKNYYKNRGLSYAIFKKNL